MNVDTKIVGILNITRDSFSDGGMFYKLNNAVSRYNEMLANGADFIDIGAQSTSYDRNQITQESEWELLEPILGSIQHKELVSIDTYNYLTAKKSIEAGVGIINDVSAGRDPKILDLIANNPHVKYICMFSLVVPADRKIRAESSKDVYRWCEQIIERLQKARILLNQIILDPGIGFATDEQTSFEIIANCGLLQKYGVEVMIGHSRKSFFHSVTQIDPIERDIETLAASIHMFNQVNYLRVHNVETHIRAKKVIDKLRMLAG